MTDQAVPANGPGRNRPKPTFWHSLRVWVNSALTLGILTIGAVVMFVVGLLTLFRARGLYNEVLAKWISTVVLVLWGIRVVVHRDYPLPSGQVVYISNHTSSLDVFVVVSMGLPQCRFFLSSFLRYYIPLGVMATIMGTFFVVPQKYPEKRTRIFANATKILQRTGESVFLTPEGARITTGKIGHFNKGAFHIATVLKAPIVPFYIQTQKAANPGKGYDVRPGCVNVYFKPIIATREWELNHLNRNREQVRSNFVTYHDELGAV